MRRILYLLMIACCFYSCNLDEEPISKVSKDPVFSSENGLQLYAYSFYDMLPSASDAHKKDEMCDYAARREVPDFVRAGAYGPHQSANMWSTKVWKQLRNVNYFLENCDHPNLSPQVISNYQGIARFFRAWFYFERVKEFGDVPWLDRALDVDDNEGLYAPRDPRTLVMDKVLEDLNFACENISMDSDPTASRISRMAAYAFKSRVCLFEGTYRKYHTELGLVETAGKWLTEAANAAEQVMKDSEYQVYMDAGVEMSYRSLFTKQKPEAKEVILASVCDESLSVLNDANWWWTSSTYGPRISLIRTFVNTYLNADGTPFTKNPGYKEMAFADEMEGRDKRLSQTIRTSDYQRIDGGVFVSAPPIFTYTYTGYQPIKFCLDDMYYDSGANNNNSIALIRYAEVLLNYAEAKAELGTLTDQDWAETIGKLRARGGITGGLTAKPTEVDTYLQSAYFPEIADPVLLEIRRERGIELVFEGFRLADLKRWKKGKLIENRWNGFYVPALDTPMDLDGDGTPDVCFTFEEEVPNPIPGVSYLNVAPTKGGSVNPQQLSDGTKGELIWLDNIPRVWEDKNYLYPIPPMVILMNNNLTQNPGW